MKYVFLIVFLYYSQIVFALDECSQYLKLNVDWSSEWADYSKSKKASEPVQNILSLVKPNFLQMSSLEQSEHLWNLMLQTQYLENRLPQFYLKKDLWVKLKSFLQVRKVFGGEGIQFLSPGYVKVFHPIGASAIFKFKPALVDQKGYGVFDKETYGIVRFSLGLPLENNYIPGVAFSFLLQNHSPVGLHAMPSLEGQGANMNPFENAVSNKLPPLKNRSMKVLATILRLASLGRDPLRVPIDQLFEINSDAVDANKLLDIEELVLTPTEIARAYIDPSSKKDPRENLADIPKGLPIYYVFSVSSLGVVSKLGTISVETEILSSLVGDLLRIKHQD